MSSREPDLTIDKIRLIYEFNNNSPLFARVASAEIDRANILEAIKILEKGIEIHPSYPTPYFLLAIAKAYEGNEDEARAKVIIGNELLGSSEALELYDKKISEILAERNSLTEAKRPVFTEKDKEEIDGHDFDNLEDKLDILAERLSKAKIIPKTMGEPASEIQAPDVNIKRIVSDTMAEIFLEQKNYAEAISIYEELLEQKPDRADIYLQKINDIRDLM